MNSRVQDLRSLYEFGNYHIPSISPVLSQGLSGLCTWQAKISEPACPLVGLTPCEGGEFNNFQTESMIATKAGLGIRSSQLWLFLTAFRRAELPF